MRIIAFIEDATLIQVILKHLGLWETKNNDPPPLDSFHTANELTVDESYSQIPLPIPSTEVKLFCADGTARAAVWESRSPPKLISTRNRFYGSGFFYAADLDIWLSNPTI
jgi:hypothetical protein